jgi:hypothetical protein
MPDSSEYQVLKQTNKTIEDNYHIAIAEAIAKPGRAKRLKHFDTARRILNKEFRKANDLYQKAIRRGVL